MKITRRPINASAQVAIPAPFDEYYTIMPDNVYEELTGTPAKPSPCEEANYGMKHIYYLTALPEWKVELDDIGLREVELVREGNDILVCFNVRDRVFRVDPADLPGRSVDDELEDAFGDDPVAGIATMFGIDYETGELIFDWYFNKGIAQQYDSVRDLLDFVNEDIYSMLDEYGDEDNWTTARVKAYCSQVSQIPHCYETMICSPLKTQLTAVIDLADSTSCDNSNDYTKNTCRNVVTISEILYGTGKTPVSAVTTAVKDSAAIREYCLQDALDCSDNSGYCLRDWKKSKTYSISYYNSINGQRYSGVTPSTYTTDSLPMTNQRPTDPDAQAGCTFEGWCSDGEYNSDKTCGATPSSTISLPKSATGNMAYYAIWDCED